ncbi:hypothetical protein [Streptomyces sp. WAC 05379]|uniref:hypothetical protein n=1 Tax=Streptomyces sp. WAC 05379 TaxID=2203207 RepID=UPI0026B06E04
MLLRESAASVAARILEGSLALHLTENFRHQHGRMPTLAEIRSWERSPPALTNALIEAGLDGVEGQPRARPAAASARRSDRPRSWWAASWP